MKNKKKHLLFQDLTIHFFYLVKVDNCIFPWSTFITPEQKQISKLFIGSAKKVKEEVKYVFGVFAAKLTFNWSPKNQFFLSNRIIIYVTFNKVVKKFCYDKKVFIFSNLFAEIEPGGEFFYFNKTVSLTTPVRIT